MTSNDHASAVIWFSDIGIGDVPSVGGKNASLGELLRVLGPRGVHVPNGFATTAQAYRDFVVANDLEARMRGHIARYQAGSETLQEAGHAIRKVIMASSLHHDLAEVLREAYRKLAEITGTRDPSVAVRSSATAEDLPDASFAGQHETFLNVRGEQGLLDACLRCFASLFTDRAISYRQAKGYDHFDVALSVGVQQMVRADLAGSGVMFTVDTETGFPRTVTINATWGLGETIV